MKNITIAHIIIVGFLWSCSQQGSESKSAQKRNGDSTASGSSAVEQQRMITLPTPMQIPALLKNTDATYNPDLLLPITTDAKPYFRSGVLFGMYMLDMAYSGSYSHQQVSMNYMQACKRIGDELGLGMKISEAHVERFRNNLNKPDSLGRIILHMYDIGHKVLIEQNKEGLGFLMALGCYIEGLHLVMEQAREHDLILYLHLLQQQKGFAQNLVIALDDYEIPGEIATEHNQFMQINNAFMALEIPTVYELKTGKKTVAGIDKKQIEKIRSAIAEFRNSMLI